MGRGRWYHVAHRLGVGRHAGREVGQRLGVGHLGHRRLVLEALLGHLEARLQVEDGLAVLDGHHAAGGERAAVADAVDLVEDRHGGVTGPQEVGVERVHRPARLHRAGGGHEGLARHLAAEHPLAVLVGRQPRKMLTSIGSRSSSFTRASTASWDMAAILAYRGVGYGPAPCPTHDLSRRVPLGHRHRRPPDRGRQRQQRLVAVGAHAGLGLQGVERRRCDSWHRWPEDVALLKELGFTDYRFSLEWSRIEPADGEFSTVALDHYVRLCEGLLEAGIAPVVTFHHFTTPLWLADQGGWESDAMPERFAAYCEKAAARLDGADAAGVHDQRAEHGVDHRLPVRAPSRPASGTGTLVATSTR